MQRRVTLELSLLASSYMMGDVRRAVQSWSLWALVRRRLQRLLTSDLAVPVTQARLRGCLKLWSAQCSLLHSHDPRRRSHSSPSSTTDQQGGPSSRVPLQPLPSLPEDTPTASFRTPPSEAVVARLRGRYLQDEETAATTTIDAVMRDAEPQGGQCTPS